MGKSISDFFTMQQKTFRPSLHKEKSSAFAGLENPMFTSRNVLPNIKSTSINPADARGVASHTVFGYKTKQRQFVV